MRMVVSSRRVSTVLTMSHREQRTIRAFRDLRRSLTQSTWRGREEGGGGEKEVREGKGERAGEKEEKEGKREKGGKRRRRVEERGVVSWPLYLLVLEVVI